MADEATTTIDPVIEPVDVIAEELVQRNEPETQTGRVSETRQSPPARSRRRWPFSRRAKDEDQDDDDERELEFQTPFGKIELEFEPTDRAKEKERKRREKAAREAARKAEEEARKLAARREKLEAELAKGGGGRGKLLLIGAVVGLAVVVAAVAIWLFSSPEPEEEIPPEFQSDLAAAPEPRGFMERLRNRIRRAIRAGKEASREAQKEQEELYEELTRGG